MRFKVSRAVGSQSYRVQKIVTRRQLCSGGPAVRRSMPLIEDVDAGVVIHHPLDVKEMRQWCEENEMPFAATHRQGYVLHYTVTADTTAKEVLFKLRWM